MSKPLQPELVHIFAGTVWRMEVDPKGRRLALEVRSEKDKQVSFAVIDLSSSQILLEKYSTEERWLSGLEGIFNNVMLLHYYRQASSPEHKGLIAVDAGTGETLWSNYNYALHHFSINGPVVYDVRLQPRVLQLADVETGVLIRRFEPAIDGEPDLKITLPEIADGAGLAEPAFGNIVHRLFYNQYIIVSLHSQAVDGGLVQKLFIMFDNAVIYSDVLNAGIQKLQPEAFVLYNNQLIYLKERSQLKIINL